MPGSVWSAKKKKRRPKLAIENRKRYFFLLPFLLVIVFADQISKIWVLNNIAPGDKIRILGDFFRLSLTYNTGGAMGTSLGGNSFYLITSLFVLGIIFYLVIRSIKRTWPAAALMAIAGGAIGNIIDRVHMGRVIDFLDFDIPNVNILGLKLERWWTFNIADSAITLGVIALLMYIIFYQEKAEDKAPSPQNQ